MNGHKWLWCVGLLIVLAGPTDWAAAEKQAPLEWHNDFHHAWKATQADGRPMLLFFTIDDCLFCAKMKAETYGHAEVVSHIRRSFVPLSVDGQEAELLAKKLGVEVYPTTVIVSPGAKVLDTMHGFIEPEPFQKRLTTATGRLKTTER